MKNRIFFYIIFFYYLYYIETSEVIIFNLNYSINSPFFQQLYVDMNIGEPKSAIRALISSKIPYFSMIKVHYKYYPDNYYKISKSNSYLNISALNRKYVTSFYDIHSQENFFFTIYNNETKVFKEIEIKNMDFVLGIESKFEPDEYYYLNIGFPLTTNYFSLVHQVKHKNIIKNYNWFILYEENNIADKDDILTFEDVNNTKITLIIGDSPHYYNTEKFFENQLLKTNIAISKWTLELKEAYFYSDDSELGEKNKIHLDANYLNIYFDDLSIYAPSIYINAIRRIFFTKYITDNICQFSYDVYKRFYCDKSDKFSLKELRKFPTLYFEHASLNYTFELTYKDLFMEKDNIYYFMVTELPDGDDETWLVGYSFLKKYQFVFNVDAKTIGFYNPNLPRENDTHTDTHSDTDSDKDSDTDKGSDKKSESNTDGIIGEEDNFWDNKLIIIICAAGAVVLIIISIIIGKIIIKNLDKKKKANELDENYDYISQDNIN